jgi:hypothetical protein
MKKLFITFLIFFIFQYLLAPAGLNVIIRGEPVSISLSWENIEKYLIEFKVRQPEIVMSQIKHETGNLTSRFCKEQNNLFGMRLARSRETTAVGECNHMAQYISWQESLQDYKIYQDLYYCGGDYYQFLSNSGYATDPWYIWKLKRIKKLL